MFALLFDNPSSVMDNAGLFMETEQSLVCGPSSG